MRTLCTIAVVSAALAAFGAGPGSVPIVYTTDLYHPHDDPDDHYDLLTLFAMPEFDIRAIVIDTGERGKDRPGVPALEQAMRMAGRRAPFSVGLMGNLASQSDACEDRPEAEQQGVKLILDALRQSAGPVTIFATGSLRDVAAACNRNPDLFKSKMGRLYANAGHSGGGEEWNVKLDPNAYVRILHSGLPVYWVPCFGTDGYASYWKFRQGDVLDAAPSRVRNYVFYALTKADPATADPLAFLDVQPDPKQLDAVRLEDRNMWCTAAFLHAAGRTMRSCSFQEAAVAVDDRGRTMLAPQNASATRLQVFHVDDPAAYPAEMIDAIRSLLVAMPVSGK